MQFDERKRVEKAECMWYPGGLYGKSTHPSLSTKNIHQNKKPIIYNIYKYIHLIYHIHKYTHYILFNNKYTSDKSIINLHPIINFQIFFKNKKGGLL